MWGWLRNRREHKEFYDFFKRELGFTPRSVHLYQVAFIHKSKSELTPQGRRINNERLEYLGDALLTSMVAEMLFRRYPGKGEGYLTELRAKIVSRKSLNRLAHDIGLAQLIQYNRESQGIFKSIEGDAFEAIVGAIYLEKGYRFTRKVIVDRVILRHIDIDAIANADWNFKSKLIDWGQKNRRQVAFEVVHSFEQGPTRRRCYECRATIDGEPYESATDYTIKAAEQQAAEKTFHRIQAEGLVES